MSHKNNSRTNPNPNLKLYNDELQNIDRFVLNKYFAINSPIFLMETIDTSNTYDNDFGRTTKVTISKNGDLYYKAPPITITLPPITISKNIQK